MPLRLFKRFITSIVLGCFISAFLGPIRTNAQTVDLLGLPMPGTMINLTPAYVPVIARGLRVHPDNPLLFDFIVDTGNSGLASCDPNFKAESEKIIKYFLASLTIPDDDQWVNLSPYEKDRIIPAQLGQTEMGRDMLAEDYILKQLTASLIYPERKLGRDFWDRVYAKSRQLFGTSDIPVNTFNKVWITADKADLYVRNNTAFIVGAHLRVMLEEDYLSLAKHGSIKTAVHDTNNTHAIGNQIIREIILPELEKEVNTGKHFSNLRQIFYSMILAAWYKKNLKETLLNQVFSNRFKIDGVKAQDKNVKEKIYQEYLKAYKKGVFNYIKEDLGPAGRTSVPRKYFSGGIRVDADTAMTVLERVPVPSGYFSATGRLAEVRVIAETRFYPRLREGVNPGAMMPAEGRAVDGINGMPAVWNIEPIKAVLENIPEADEFDYSVKVKGWALDYVQGINIGNASNRVSASFNDKYWAQQFLDGVWLTARWGLDVTFLREFIRNHAQIKSIKPENIDKRYRERFMLYRDGIIEDATILWDRWQILWSPVHEILGQTVFDQNLNSRINVEQRVNLVEKRFSDAILKRFQRYFEKNKLSQDHRMQIHIKSGEQRHITVMISQVSGRETVLPLEIINNHLDGLNKALFPFKIMEVRTQADVLTLILETVDSAMLLHGLKAAIQQRAPGGIDFNTKNMAMKVTGDKVSMTFDPAMAAQLHEGDFSGIYPKILSIASIASISKSLDF